MKVYKVYADGAPAFIAGTQAEVTTRKKQLIEDYGIKRKDIDVNQLDLPTGKAGLLPALNTLLASEFISGRKSALPPR